MIRRSDITQLFRAYADEAADTDGGASVLTLVDRLKREHPEVQDLGAEMLSDALRRLAENALKPMRSETMQFPGMGDPIGTTVTVPDGEGGHRVKRLRLATIPDLEADLAIHDENVAAAVHARSTADRRNRRLIPVMKEHSFDVAGDALALLRDEAS